MTVLTLPFITAKSDNVRLVNDVDRPKLLEAGDGGSLMVNTSNVHLRAKCKRLVWKMIVATLILLALLLVVTKAYHQQSIEHNIQRQWYAIPSKPYTSYEDAENDMLSMPSSPASTADSEYEVSQFDFMEVLFKKLENIALEPKENSVDVVISSNVIFSDSHDFDSEFDTISSSLIINPTRFIHDFSINVTGIIDTDGKRCYVMPLLSGMVSRPKSMNELLFKISTGYYSTDVKKVIAQLPVFKPALKDLSDYGLYIPKDCANYSTYRLDTTGLTTADMAFV